MTSQVKVPSLSATDADVIEALVVSVTDQLTKLDQIPERLITVQSELGDIRETLHTSYPSRKEVKRSRWKMFFLIIGLVIGLQFIQSTEVTNCFLNVSTKNPTICHIIYPGYSKAVNDQRDRSAQLRDEVAAQKQFDNQVIQYKDQLVAANKELAQEIKALQAEIQQLKAGH